MGCAIKFTKVLLGFSIGMIDEGLSFSYDEREGGKMMKRLYAVSKKCEQRFGVRAEFLCLFLSVALWLAAGAAAAFLFGRLWGLTYTHQAEMMKTMGSMCGISFGYVYGMVWLMRHAS